MTTHDLAQLHAHLDAIDVALDEDVHAAEAQMTAYQDQLQAFIVRAGSQAPAEALRRLLDAHNALLTRMRDRQDTIGESLRLARRAENASLAYAQSAR